MTYWLANGEGGMVGSGIAPCRMAGALLLGLIAGFGQSAGAAPSPIALPGERMFPESFSATTDGTFYIGSVAEGGVMRIRPGSQAEAWIKPGAFGTRSVFGVLADERSGMLWLCSNDVSAGGVAGPGSETGSALKGFDLKTGEGRVSAKFPGDKNFCNDMAVGPDGAVYVTNTTTPQILKLPPAGKTLEVWLAEPRIQLGKGGGLDGIAFGGDGNLYVNTFGSGELFRVTLKDGAADTVTKLTTSHPLAMADGMRPIGGNGFAMIEGAGRLDRVTVEGDKAMVETLREGLNSPTAVALVGVVAWVSEGQLPALFGKKPPKLPFSLVPTQISKP
jgi:sugar lactone lactonase YvrE